MSSQSAPAPTDYGLKWPAGYDALEREFWMIRKGDDWLKQQGRSLFFHYRTAQSLIWPEDDHHRWSDLLLKSFCDEEITVMLGCGDSAKTWTMSKFAMLDYWVYPDETLWLLSSTEFRGAELRVWGKVKEFFNRGRKRYPWLQGNVLEFIHTITTDEIDEEGIEARSLQRGLILVPIKKGGISVGLSAFVGVKSPRLRHAGDECQFFGGAFLDAYSNWYGKENFKGLMAGNPLDITDALCTAAEPAEGGWDNFVDTGRTQTHRSKFYNAHVICLDGRDSPNFDNPRLDGRPRYPYLIGPKKLDAVAATHGKDSWQWFNQCIGKPNKNLALWRVLTRNLCDKHHACDEPTWLDGTLTTILGLDPAYGGGDDCTLIRIEFGKDIDSKVILCVSPPEIIPIKANIDSDPEEQIAHYINRRIGELSIPAKNVFYDSTGKGTLGFAFAKIMGKECPVPVSSGDKPTTRPVRFDWFVKDDDGRNRLKRCDEHYSKFITEMWFSVREVVESDQMRGLPHDVRDEFCARTFKIVQGNRTEIEPKQGSPAKPGFKERMGYSPNKADSLAIAVEGARQRSFQIKRLGPVDTTKIKPDWLDKLSSDYNKFLEKRAQLAA